MLLWGIHCLWERETVYVVLVYFFVLIFSGVKVLHFAYTVAHPSLSLPSLEPPSVLQSSPVTPEFSPNVNPNRLSTEGYCSSSQKRRQIFRYWGAADLCVAMHIFWKWFGDGSGDLLWFLYLCLAYSADWSLFQHCTVGLPMAHAWLLCGFTWDWLTDLPFHAFNANNIVLFCTFL